MSASQRVMANILEMPLAFAALRAFSAPTSKPEPAAVTMSTLSAARMPSLMPPAKSKRPGVSIIFIFAPFHSIAATAVETVAFLFFSSASKSSTVVPSATLPSLSVAFAV